MTTSRRGTLILCEDSSGDNYIRGLTRDSDLFDIALNRLRSGTGGSRFGDEFAGSTFGPDGSTLFVNIQASAGMTFAIWGRGRGSAFDPSSPRIGCRMTKVGQGPMLAKLEPGIPRGPGWTYEPKWDGFRTIVTVGDEIRLDSRTDRPMVRFFPELVSLLEDRREGPFVADGEIVMVRPGRLAFDELQLRLHPAESRVRKLAAEIPASLILFDLLEDGGEKLGQKPLAERRDRLAALSNRLHVPQAAERLEDLDPGPELLLTPWTDDLGVAEGWFADEAGLGQDGIVAKRDDQPYLPGARGWVKVKHRKTADCVVGGYRVAKDGEGVGSLLLGLYDDEDRLHYVGHTSSFKAKERREIQELLRPLEEGAESFVGGREPGGPSRWSAGKDTAWVTVRPVLVCEVAFDRIQYGRIRHAATFLRWRPDREPGTCTWAQLGETSPSWGEEGS